MYCQRISVAWRTASTRLGLPRRGRAMALDDLVAALAVYLVGLDVDGEELHLAVGEAVVRLEGGQVAPVDPRHLRFETDEQSSGGVVERLVRHLVAPGGQAARGGNLARRLDVRRGHPAGLGESDEQVDVLGPGFFLDDVLQQEVARVGIGAVPVDASRTTGETAPRTGSAGTPTDRAVSASGRR